MNLFFDLFDFPSFLLLSDSLCDITISDLCSSPPLRSGVSCNDYTRGGGDSESKDFKKVGKQG